MIYIVFLSFWLPTYLTLVPLTSLFKALKAVSVDEDTGAGSGGVTGPRSHELQIIARYEPKFDFKDKCSSASEMQVKIVG